MNGKTYSLYGNSTDSDEYYKTIRDLADLFLKKCPDRTELLEHIQRAGTESSLIRTFRSAHNKSFNSYITRTLRDALRVYTAGVKKHLRALPLTKRFDETLRTKEFQYHLYMLEIELVNRVYGDAFNNSKYRFALIAHCLRDFRPECMASPGDYESACRSCTKDCFIHLGSVLLRKYNIHPFISVSMDLDTLFKKIKSEHDSVGALGVACVPELVQGMRLCIKLGIPPIGLPLDANRCARWMKECKESSFNLTELERLVN